jgi:hypothetical protein
MSQKFLGLISSTTLCCMALNFLLPANAVTFLSYSSESGDNVGRGESKTFTTNDGYFRVSNNLSLNEINISFTEVPLGGDNFWSLVLASHRGTTLVPGTYQGATRFPYPQPNPLGITPGIRFSTNGRECNALTGSFNIQNISYDLYGKVSNLRADFEQYCRRAGGGLFGQVAFDRNDFDTVNLTRLLGLTDKIQEYETALYYFSQPGDNVGRGLEEILTPEDLDFTVARNPFYGIDVFINNYDRSDRTDSIYTRLNFAAPGNTTLIPGLYDRSVRYPLQTSNRGSLSFINDSRTCSQSSGRFQVIEASYTPRGAVEKFDALFEQHCGDDLAIGSAAFGRIRYNATVKSASSESVPEPTTIVGILTFGAWLITQRKRISI